MCEARVPAVLVVLVVLTAGQESELSCRSSRCHYNEANEYWPEYIVDGKKIKMKHNDVGLIINCFKTNVLESTAMPRFLPLLSTSRLWLAFCPLPNSALAKTFAAINVTLESGNLTLLGLATTLEAKHFVGLENLNKLEIDGEEKAQPHLERGFLAPLQKLRSLKIRNAILSPGEVTVTPTLESLVLYSWAERHPKPMAPCDSLRTLELTSPIMESLPDGWLQNCTRLEVVTFYFAMYLKTLPSKLLLGASALMQLRLMQGSLERLPPGLLDHSPYLRKLQLNSNKLTTLRSDTFKVASRVQELDLSSNKLTSSAIVALAPLHQLIELQLSTNRGLRNVCGTDGYSAIRNSTQLKKLLLSFTAVNRICRDWLEDMTQLDILDLSFTRVANVTFKELRFKRTVETKVYLPDASLTAVQMTQEDYIEAVRRVPIKVTLFFYGAPTCDCHMYWTRRALNLSLPALKHIRHENCAGSKRKLGDMAPEELTCARPEECRAAALPTACTCSMWAADDPDHDPRLVRVRCESVGLENVPRPRPVNQSRLYELLLANNRITHLSADDIQDNIKGLDLRNNNLIEVKDEETAKRLGNIEGMLSLAENLLECSCRGAPLIRALRARPAAVTDLTNTTCSDGRRLNDASVDDCHQESSWASSGVWLASGVAVLLALCLALTAFLASRQRRFFTLAVLHRYGVEWRAAQPPEDAARRYDAFLTFSHLDEDVAREVMTRLEPTYTLCIHHRDWTPGLPICSQVVESVHQSRRTIALVSRNFLQSSWACVEFREAYAASMAEARPRLIVVLLEEPAALEMDSELRWYISTHTYVRWGEPWFWEKLAVALPRPRAHPSPQASISRFRTHACFGIS